MQNCDRKRKTAPHIDRLIFRSAHGSPSKQRKVSAEISAEFSNNRINISAQTVRGRLEERGLRGSIAAKNPYV